MPTCLVTGATGRQGGSLASTLLASGETVHALVRDLSSPASLALKSAGAILFSGTFSDIDAISSAAKGADSVFINVSPSFVCPNAELEHAKNILSASLKAGVKHVVCSSVVWTWRHEQFPGWFDDYASSLIGDYWRSKNAIEEAVRSSGAETWTILRPGYFMTNLIPPLVTYMFPEILTEGLFKSVYDKETKLGLLDPRDIGKVARRIFEDPKKWSGREIDIVGNAKSVEDILKVYSHVSEKEIAIEGLKDEEVEGFQKIVVDNQKLQVKLDKAGTFGYDLRPLEELGVEMKSWKAFLEEKKESGELEG